MRADTRAQRRSGRNGGEVVAVLPGHWVTAEDAGHGTAVIWLRAPRFL